MMPEVDGYDVLSAMRGAETATIPFIFSNCLGRQLISAEDGNRADDYLYQAVYKRNC